MSSCCLAPLLNMWCPLYLFWLVLKFTIPNTRIAAPSCFIVCLLGSLIFILLLSSKNSSVRKRLGQKNPRFEGSLGYIKDCLYSDCLKKNNPDKQMRHKCYNVLNNKGENSDYVVKLFLKSYWRWGCSPVVEFFLAYVKPWVQFIALGKKTHNCIFGSMTLNVGWLVFILSLIGLQSYVS